VIVSEDDIRHVVSKWTGVPLSRMEQADMDRLLRVSEELKGKVIGQDEAVYAWARRCAVPAPTSRTRSGPSARLFSSVRLAWARPT